MSPPIRSLHFWLSVSSVMCRCLKEGENEGVCVLAGFLMCDVGKLVELRTVNS